MSVQGQGGVCVRLPITILNWQKTTRLRHQSRSRLTTHPVQSRNMLGPVSFSCSQPALKTHLWTPNQFNLMMLSTCIQSHLIQTPTTPQHRKASRPSSRQTSSSHSSSRTPSLSTKKHSSLRKKAHWCLKTMMQKNSRMIVQLCRMVRRNGNRRQRLSKRSVSGHNGQRAGCLALMWSRSRKSYKACWGIHWHRPLKMQICRSSLVRKKLRRLKEALSTWASISQLNRM